MGAEEFFHKAEGETAEEAFRNAKEEAEYEYGHAGYSGTIAEKDNFVMIPCPEGMCPHARAEELMDKNDRRIRDKWGPAGCIAMGDGKFLFFGWASS